MPENYFLSPDDNPRFRKNNGPLDKMAEMAARLEDFFRRATFTALIVLAMIAGGLTGLVLAYQASFTSFAAEVEGLAEYRPSEVTKVYADDGKTVIGELEFRLDRHAAAERSWREALRLTTARAEREFLHRRLAACGADGDEPRSE